MSLDRTTIFQEPGLLSFNSQTFYSQGAISVDLVEDRFDVESDMFGPIDERVSDRRIEIKFTPIGELEALSTLFPMGGLTLGTSLFGATDTAATIYTPSGKSLAVHNCAVTTQPTVSMAHDKPLFGEVTITGLLKNNTNPDAADAYYTYTASGASYPGDSAFSASAVKTLGYEAAWGGAPWDQFYSESGFTLSISPDIQPVKADGHGTVDMRLQSLSAEISGVPIGVAPGDILTKREFQGTGNALGASRASGDDLIITNQVGATAFYVMLYGAVIQDTPLRFSGQERSPGEVGWRATREFTAGSADPLYYIGTSAPS